MALTPQIRAAKGGSEAVATGSVDIRSAKAGALALVNYPVATVRAAMAGALGAVAQVVDVRASMAGVQVVCAGRVEYPYVRAWTFTLHGHDYYVLQTQDKTFVFDMHSEQWYVWGTRNSELWRAQVGVDWNANLANITTGIGGKTISNVLVGDYANGALYFLHPEKDVDDEPDGSGAVDFKRVIYSQITLRGRSVKPCFGVQLYGSVGEAFTASDATVTLSYSDDEGHTFVAADPVYTLISGEYAQWVDWRSLGAVRAPGRLFKVEDYGALARIDGMEEKDE